MDLSTFKTSSASKHNAIQNELNAVNQLITLLNDEIDELENCSPGILAEFKADSCASYAGNIKAKANFIKTISNDDEDILDDLTGYDSYKPAIATEHNTVQSKANTSAGNADSMQTSFGTITSSSSAQTIASVCQSNQTTTNTIASAMQAISTAKAEDVRLTSLVQ